MDDVKEFVAAATKCDFDIDVTYNKVIVDAKSFLGVLSLASLPVLVEECLKRNEKARSFKAPGFLVQG